MWFAIVAFALLVAAVPARSIAESISTAGISFTISTPPPTTISVGAISFTIKAK
jgi:hypothetical protein